MCEAHDLDERLCMVRNARVAADEILDSCFRIPLVKAFNLETPSGFDQAVMDLAASLRKTTMGDDVAAVRAAIGVLDVNWHITTPRQRRELISKSLLVAGRKTAGIPSKIMTLFGDAAEKVVRATRMSVRSGQKLAIGADFNALDKRVVKHLKESQSFWVADEYGRRFTAFGDEAAHVVAKGLEAGLGRADIAQNLHGAAQKTMIGRSSFYWDVVAGAFVGRGRSFAQLSSYSEARIDRYRIEAVLDEVTTDTCRFLHGKILSVKRGLDLFKKIEKSPESIKEINPWIRRGRNENGESILYVNKAKGRVPLATVAESGVGNVDKVGAFRNSLTEDGLMDLGIGFPGYHGLCRTTTVAVV